MIVTNRVSVNEVVSDSELARQYRTEIEQLRLRLRANADSMDNAAEVGIMLHILNKAVGFQSRFTAASQPTCACMTQTMQCFTGCDRQPTCVGLQVQHLQQRLQIVENRNLALVVQLEASTGRTASEWEALPATPPGLKLPSQVSHSNPWARALPRLQHLQPPTQPPDVQRCDDAPGLQGCLPAAGFAANQEPYFSRAGTQANC